MPTQIVSYSIDNDLVVSFEVAPVPGFVPASTGETAGRVRQAIGPAVEAAREVLDRAKELCPDKVDVKFGIKVTGTTNWIVAKAATEGNFEVTLSWTSQVAGPAAQGEAE
jgi:hypothetical protein